MQTQFTSSLLPLARRDEVERLMRRCVHCGFCNSACPTYRATGNELDSPRGRIYLMKHVLEGAPPSAAHLNHLDRCLDCQSCETACPSGVEYARLLDLVRPPLAQQAGRAPQQRLLRALILGVVPHRARFAAALALARRVAPLLPARWRDMIPAPPPRNGAASAGAAADTATPAGMPTGAATEAGAAADTTTTGAPVGATTTGAPTSATTKAGAPAGARRRMVALAGCVQAVAAPEIHARARTLLASAGAELIEIDGCCGALAHHMGRARLARRQIRRNLDRLRPLLMDDDATLVGAASGCGRVIRAWGEIMRDDAVHAAEAARAAARYRDLCEVLDARDYAATAATAALHIPCTLSHGQGLGGRLERLLTGAGLRLAPTRDAHLCCGSAGFYSLTQPRLAERLLEDKLARLTEAKPERILTANIGCLLHLRKRSPVPVEHWTAALRPAGTSAGAS